MKEGDGLDVGLYFELVEDLDGVVEGEYFVVRCFGVVDDDDEKIIFSVGVVEDERGTLLCGGLYESSDDGGSGVIAMDRFACDLLLVVDADDGDEFVGVVDVVRKFFMR